MRALLKGAMFVASCVLLLPTLAHAQASIAGVVKDASGGVIPGVTVEASSPALIEKIRDVVTDGTGQYKIVDLRPGTYTVTFTLSGFNTFKREGIELAGSFNATVNAELRVGELSETVTVTGESPIVDVQNAAQQRVLTKDVLDAIPAGRSPASFAILIPGMTGTNDLGGSNNLNMTALTVHGGSRNGQRVMIDGLSIGNSSGAGEVSNFIPDQTSTQEMSVTYSAGAAEQAFGGVQINLIPREGGNSIKGSFYGTGVNSSFQGSNVTQELKDRGLSTPGSLNLLYDINPGAGGPLIKDKLWFYSAARWQATKQYIAGLWNNLNAGDPTKWTYAPDFNNQAQTPLSQWSVNTRLTFQATERNKFSVFREQQGRKWDQARATVSPESTIHYDFPQNSVSTAGWSSPLTNRLLIDVRASDLVQGFNDRYPREDYSGALSFGDPIPGVYKNLISVTEQGGIIPGLLYRGGGQGSSSGTQPYISNRAWVAALQGSVSYVTGAHALKFGIVDTAGERDVTYNDTIYALKFRFNNGVPNQLTQQATPYRFINRVGSEWGLFAQDKWTLNRMTVNAGLRFDTFDLHFPESHLGPGPLVPTRDLTLPNTPYINWKDISPRVGVVYDLFGNGKTALKASLAYYVIPQRTSNDYSTLGNPVNALAQQVPRSWSDTTYPAGDARRGNFWPDCDFLNPLANGECGALTDVNFGKAIASTKSDPDMLQGWNKRPTEREYEIGIQHQLLPRVGVDLGYYRKSLGNFTVVDNQAVSASDFSSYSITAPLDSRLPGGGGYAISGLNNLNPNKVGQVDNLFTLASKYGDRYENWNGVDASINLRLQRGILLQGGTSTGRTTTDNCAVVAAVPESAIAGSSNSALYCHVENPFQTQVKFLGSFTVPKIDVLYSATLQSTPGPNIGASYVASNALIQPSLGRPLSGGAANVTVNLVSPAAMWGDRINTVDMRFSKILRFGARRLNVNLDLYNALNSSDITTLNANFATWQVPQAIVLPRFAKISAQFDF